jgi:transglutaminase-like putative cysteine protease
MPIQVALTHRTVYRYDRAVALGPHLVRLRPAPHCRTPVSAYALHLTPARHCINWQQDPFGNFVARVIVPEKTSEFVATADLIAEMAPINPFDFFADESAKDFPFAYDPATASDLRPYLDAPAQGPLLEHYLSKVDVSPRSTIAFISDLNVALSQRIVWPWRRSCSSPLASKSSSESSAGQPRR